MDKNSSVTPESIAGEVHFEEFKMYLESAERTTDRRLELNKTNASLSILILAGIGAIVSWGSGKPALQPFCVMAVGAISLLASVFCRWWWNQLVSYKELNAAKFEVLNSMAPRIVFPDAKDRNYCSDEPFRKEWEILQDRKSLKSFRGRLALGASLSEVTIPVAFFVTFLSVFLIAFLLSISDRYDLVILKALGYSL